LIAQRENTTLRYVHQDSLSSTSVMSDSSGTSISSISYLPFGSTRTGSVNTTKKFTGQRLDSTGLYYYGARYYDAGIGRFISPDTLVQSFSNPQTLNRYSYCLNNPLKYTDPSGHYGILGEDDNGNPIQISPTGKLSPNAIPHYSVTWESASPAWDSWDALTIEFGPKEIDAWRPNLISTLSVNHIGGIEVANMIVSGQIIVQSVGNQSAVSMNIKGDWNNKANELNPTAYINIGKTRLDYETERGAMGSVGLLNTIDIQEHSINNKGDIGILQYSGNTYIPAIQDCYSMKLTVSFYVYDPNEYGIKQGPAFLRPQQFTIDIKRGAPAFRSRR
jgi:RHS repeat-associated protein